MNRFFSFLFLFIGLTLIPHLKAEESNPQTKFVQANQLFEKGETEQALDLYKSLIRQGFGGSALFYNMGNLYFKKGERGQAVLWYERAARLDPRDSDIEFNLNLARSHIKEGRMDQTEKFIGYFTVNEMGILFTIFSWAFFILLGFRLNNRWEGEVWPTVLLWTLGCCLIMETSWFSLNIRQTKQPVAIVTALPGEVRNGPGTDYAVGFTIPEGSRVLVLNRRPEWTQIGVVQQGLKGWLPSSELELIEG